jgi:MFS family permease
VNDSNQCRAGHLIEHLTMFFVTQVITVLHWSRLSDIVGRKPIILFRLFGLSLSMFSVQLWALNYLLGRRFFYLTELLQSVFPLLLLHSEIYDGEYDAH